VELDLGLFKIEVPSHWSTRRKIAIGILLVLIMAFAAIFYQAGKVQIAKYFETRSDHENRKYQALKEAGDTALTTSVNLKNTVGQMLTDLSNIRDLLVRTTVAMKPDAAMEGELGREEPFKAMQDAMVAKNAALARTKFEQFDSTWDHWNASRDGLEEKLDSGIDHSLASALVDSSNGKFILDKCTIASHRYELGANKFCHVRRPKERKAFIEFSQNVDGGKNFRAEAQHLGLVIPKDLHTNLSFARQALENAIVCLEIIGEHGGSYNDRNRCTWVGHEASYRLNVAYLVNREFKDLISKRVSAKQAEVKAGVNE